MANSLEVDKALAALDTVYPHHMKQYSGKMADLARQMYHRILSDIDGALLESAVLHWLSTSRPFHPSPGELRDAALALITRDEKNGEEAWIEVHDAIRHLGSHRTPQWSNERITKTVAAFGWFDLCMTETDQMSFVRGQFIKIYEAQSKRERDDRLMLPEVKRMVNQLGKARVDELIGQAAKRLSAGRDE